MGSNRPYLSLSQLRRACAARWATAALVLACLSISTPAFSAGEAFNPNTYSLLDEPGEPFRIGGNPVHVLQGNFGATPNGAFDGTNYLVVWEELRHGSLDVYAARVTRSGAVLDPDGIQITTGPAKQIKPAVAYDGSNYLIVWADDRNGTLDIYGTRLSPDGEVLDPEGIAVTTAAGTQSYPAVAFSASRFVVVWSDERKGRVDIYGVRISSAGVLLDDEDILIAPGIASEIPIDTSQFAVLPDGPWGPSIAAEGDTFMIVWQTERAGNWQIYGGRLAASGTVLDPGGFVVSDNEEQEWYPWVASNGDEFLVVWHAVSGGGQNSWDVLGARVSSTAEVLDPDRIFISEHRFWQRYPSVGTDGTNFLVVWANWTSTRQDVYVTVVTPEGEVVDILGVPVLKGQSFIQWRPGVVFGGEDFLVVTQDERSTSGADIYGVLVGADGQPVDRKIIGISTEGDGPWRPDVSFDGSNYLVTWGDLEEGSGRVYGARVSVDGTLLDIDSTPLTSAFSGAYGPAAAFDGETHMVVWYDDRGGSWDIYGARVARTGILLDRGGIRISAAELEQQDPAIAFGAGQYMAVWSDRRSGVWNIYGSRVSTGGYVVDPDGFPIATGDSDMHSPAIAFDGEDYLVVWEDLSSGTPEIYGARLTTSGDLRDTGGFAISSGSEGCNDPSIAFDGSSYLVVWRDFRSGEGDIHAALVDTSGSVRSPGEIVVSDYSRRQWAPDVAYNGREFIVAWGDARRGKENVDVYAARVASNGVIQDPDGVGVSTDRDNQMLPAVAACEQAQVLVAHSSFVPAAIFGYWRIWGGLWNPPDEQPIEMTMSIHQNPILTSELDIILVSSKAVRDTSVWLAVDDTSVETELTDPSANVYRGGFRLTRPDVVRIVGGASDLLGIEVVVSRDFSIGVVDREAGGVIEGPDGRVSLRCPGGSVVRDSYLMIGTEQCPGDRWLISPTSLRLERQSVLRIELNGPPPGEGLEPYLWRETSSGWERVDSGYDRTGGVVSALITKLGSFKITYGPRDPGRPHQLVLLQNVPNPFASSLEVRYMMALEDEVQVLVYDAKGRLVRTLFRGRRGPGWHSEAWDGRDDSGARAPGGVYFTSVTAGGKRTSGKCVLVR